MAINLLHAHGRSRILPTTGRTTKVGDYDDGDIEAGFQLAPSNRFKATGYGTVIDLVTGLEWITHPYKMIEGTNGAVRASNQILDAHGTWALGAVTYHAGDVVGRGARYVQQFSGSGSNYQYYYMSDGTVWYCNADAFYGPDYELGYYGTTYWIPSQSHTNIYICKTQHASPADKPDWVQYAAYSIGDQIRYYGMSGYEYWKCNTNHNASEYFFYDSAYWDSDPLTTEWNSTSANWQETTWISNADPNTGGPAPKALGGQWAIYDAVHALSFAGLTDWRVPNALEALSIVDFEASTGDQDFYSDLGIDKGGQFWTSTRPPQLGNPNFSLVVFRYGYQGCPIPMSDASGLYKYPLIVRGGGFAG